MKPLRIISVNKISDSFIKSLISVINNEEPSDDIDEKVPQNLYLLSRKAHRKWFGSTLFAKFFSLNGLAPKRVFIDKVFEKLLIQFLASETCKKRVLCTKLVTEPDHASDSDRAHYLQTLLDFACEVMIWSLGVLLMYIDKNWNAVKFENAISNALGRPVFYSIQIMSG